jgi:hypothetical protein
MQRTDDEIYLATENWTSIFYAYTQQRTGIAAVLNKPIRFSGLIR